jgi:hypothetical protein
MAFSSRGYKSNFKKKDSYKTSSKGNSRDQSCFTCGKPGHRSTKCAKNPHRNQKCFKCGKRGHVKTDCRSKNKEEQSEEGGFKKTMIFTVSNSKKLDSCWLLDSGATHHLSGNSENFLELKEVDGEITVEGVSSDLLRVEGIGTIELFCKTPDGTERILLEDVRYCRGAGLNLASLSKFLKRGAEIRGKGEVCELEKNGEVFDKKVKAIQIDRGGEFWNKEINSFCRSKGIVHRKTNTYSSQENGVAEKLNRTLMEKT